MPAICLTIIILGSIIVAVGFLIDYFSRSYKLPLYTWIVGGIVTSGGLLGLMGYYIHRWIASYYV
jgi:uncharacterized SAM-binding protein YcdF (DUF218 family)